MWYDIIREILCSDVGSFAFVFFGLALVCWIVYKITEFITKWKMKEDGINKMGDKIEIISNNLVQLGSRVDALENRMDKLENRMDKLLNEFSSIKMYITKGNGGLVQSFSPISLTEKGKAVAEKMKIEAVLDKNWDNIYKYIEQGITSDNAYDLQEFCIEAATTYLSNLFTKEDIDRIKLFAYNEGNPIEFYGAMIGVLIRDRYFAQKGIRTSEVDETNPNK